MKYFGICPPFPHNNASILPGYTMPERFITWYPLVRRRRKRQISPYRKEKNTCQRESNRHACETSKIPNLEGERQPVAEGRHKPKERSTLRERPATGCGGGRRPLSDLASLATLAPSAPAPLPYSPPHPEGSWLFCLVKVGLVPPEGRRPA